jgi:CheY-like chemotaxis protein
MKILIADDNAEMRGLLRQLCATLATETRDCADGGEAIRAFIKFQPDWTLMDLAMPGVDGLTATRRIVSMQAGARVVILTQYRGAEYEQAAREAGACGFVLKEDLQPLLALLAEHQRPNSARSGS